MNLVGPSASASPAWDALQDLAVSQAGYFTTAQAARLGFSPELLNYHRKRGRLQRPRRGVYRIRHLPPQDDEQLVELWLWSGHEGVFSHLTALALYDLSDVLPSRVHMTTPASWRRRRLRVPEVLQLHFADLAEEDRQWVGHVPVTTPRRTLRDCVAGAIQPDLIRQALHAGLAQGRFSKHEIADVQSYVDRFGEER